jgi:SAM-dependent methyltransferase
VTITQHPAQEETRARLARERDYYDHVNSERSKAGTFLDRFSRAFYDKGPLGRLWAPVWKRVDFAGALVLDYGCGAGDFTHLLAQRGAKVVGVDISARLIARARSLGSQRNGSFPCFLVSDAHRAPFPDNSFDYVLGNGALHHLNLEQAYAEVARVLKPGGTAFFQEPMYHHPLLWSLRRLTPHAHTADEKPLSLADLREARRWFRKVSHREHFLLAVCAAPAHLLGKRAALATIGVVDRIDQFLMSIAPPLRRLAWLTVLEMEK